MKITSDIFCLPPTLGHRFIEWNNEELQILCKLTFGVSGAIFVYIFDQADIV